VTGTRTPLPTAVDVAIIGGGISGVVCAVETVRRGASTLLLEKAPHLAAEASGRSFGSLLVQGRDPAEVPLAVESLKLWIEASRTFARDIELVQGGNLYVAERDEQVEELRRHLDLAHRSGLADVRLLTATQTRDLVPAITGPVAADLWSPRDAHCNPGRAVQAFAREASRLGAVIATSTSVTAIDEARGHVSGVVTTRGRVATRAVVVAAGVWTQRLLAPLGIHIPIKVFTFTSGRTTPLAPLLRATLRSYRFGCRQQPDGRLYVSGGFNARVDHDVTFGDLHDLRLWLPRLWANRGITNLRVRWPHNGQAEPVPNDRIAAGGLAALTEFIPAARAARLEHTWGGLIDFSRDGLPVLDRASTPAGIVFATGLSGHGLAIAPAIGRILADLALTGDTRYPATAFRLMRLRASPAMPRRIV